MINNINVNIYIIIYYVLTIILKSMAMCVYIYNIIKLNTIFLIPVILYYTIYFIRDVIIFKLELLLINKYKILYKNHGFCYFNLKIILHLRYV